MAIPPRTDPLLNIILTVINDLGGNSLPITVMTDGGTATGRAVPVDEWLRLVAAHMRANPALDAFAQYFVEGADELSAQRELAEAAGAMNEPEPVLPGTYLHLADARLAGPGGLMPDTPSMHLRIRVNSITGWSIGTLTNETPPPGA